MKDIRAITLDLDDTLWEIAPVIRDAEAALWQWLDARYPAITRRFDPAEVVTVRDDVVLDFPEQAHDFRFLRKKVLERIALGAGYDASLVEPAFAVFDAARNTVRLFPDVIPQLEVLSSRYRIVAVTNGNANLDIIGIRRFFDEIVTAVDAGAAKPSAAIFDMAVGLAGVARDSILHVGDHPETDMAGAREAGLRTAWVNRRGDEWPSHLPAPDAVVGNLSELCELLDAAVPDHA